MLRYLPLILVALAPLRAQNPVFDRNFLKDWETSKQFTLAVADAMPADQYGFKVAPEEMSFAGLMLHIAGSQAMRFAQIAGKPVPFEMPQTLAKETVRETVKKLLTDSFDYCIGLLSKFTPEQMNKLYKVDWYERPEVTGRELVLGMSYIPRIIALRRKCICARRESRRRSTDSERAGGTARPTRGFNQPRCAVRYIRSSLERSISRCT